MMIFNEKDILGFLENANHIYINNFICNLAFDAALPLWKKLDSPFKNNVAIHHQLQKLIPTVLIKNDDPDDWQKYFPPQDILLVFRQCKKYLGLDATRILYSWLLPAIYKKRLLEIPINPNENPDAPALEALNVYYGWRGIFTNLYNGRYPAEFFTPILNINQAQRMIDIYREKEDTATKFEDKNKIANDQLPPYDYQFYMEVFDEIYGEMGGLEFLSDFYREQQMNAFWVEVLSFISDKEEEELTQFCTQLNPDIRGITFSKLFVVPPRLYVENGSET